jgi:hypothetical protein
MLACCGFPLFSTKLHLPAEQSYPYLDAELPRTGKSRPFCYARELRSCDGKRSTEHYVSHAILSQMRIIHATGLKMHPGDEPLTLDVEKMKRNKKRPRLRKLASNVLCVAHNSALSPLDAEGSTFYRSLTELVEPREAGAELRKTFKGHLMERWALKCLIGAAASNAIKQEAPLPRDWKPPLQWLHLLYGKEAWPSDWGLYLLLPDETVTGRSGRSVALHMLKSSTDGRLLGCDINFSAVYFRLVVSPLSEWDELEGWRLRRRPGYIQVVHPQGEDVLHLKWGLDQATNGVKLRLNPEQLTAP